jgi:hypothetical protein
MTFEQWFTSQQKDSFALRAEYFYEDVCLKISNERKAALMKAWLEVAYNEGIAEGLKMAGEIK